jgi:serine/threonine protein kinase
MSGRIVDGKYRLLRQVGVGGMGSVHEAEPIQGDSEGPEPAPGVEHRVAIKLLLPEVLDPEDGTRLVRFQREATAASAVDTEHIVRVLGFGTDPAMEEPYMVMELLHGEDLDHLLARVGRLPPDVVLRIAAQACLALEKAHEARVIHRDIKPANLFLARRAGGDVVVKILDFGIAKIKHTSGELSSDLTRSGTILGSLRYMSPEQTKDARRVDFRTDLWSLGMVLYHALSGKPPHDEISDLARLVLTLASSPPHLSPSVAPEVPREVASVVHGALELDPAKRFASAAAMLDAIRPLLPGGWSLDEGMVPLAGEPGPEGARHSVETVRLKESGALDAYAETRPAVADARWTRVRSAR